MAQLHFASSTHGWRWTVFRILLLIHGIMTIDHGTASEEEFINRRDALKSLGDFARMETKDHSQNAKTKWALEGDENTGFFHGTIKKRRRQLAIKGIMKNGVWIEEPGIVKAEFMSHFSHRFQQPTSIPIGLDTNHLRPLFPSKRDFFERPFSRDEINRAIWDCGGCQYKIIGKLLANRLSLVIGDCVSYVQSAFIKDRNILDGPLILNEVLAWYRQRKKKLMVFKLMVSYGRVRVFRGLRQRYPMSPFLFILAMKGLHALTSKAKALGVGVTDEEVSYMANIIGCGASKFLMKYLGVPVGCNMARLKRSTWGSILSSINSLKSKGIDLFSYCSRKIGIGNGNDSCFWDDIWCGQQPLKEVFFHIYSLDTDKGCFIANRVGLHDSNLVLRRTPRGGAESAQFNSLKDTIGNIILTYQHDSWRWSLDVSKGFSVACVRQLVDSHILVMGNEATRWNRSLPIKVNVFLWKLKLNKLSSRVNLDRIGIEISSLLCPLCLGDFETINHSFFNCNMAKGLWSLFAKWWEVDIPVCSNIAEWYEWLGGLHVYSKVCLFLRG
nr:RNA-directed DNA polymerase, eukaryota, reverse transcriptase zinc-binding domain protein [Tanacetum cinerariifolium]